MKRKALDDTEQERQATQARLDGRRNARERNRLGQFATPSALALEMATLGKKYLLARRSVRFLDPGVGSGVFFYAARKALDGRLKSARGFEVDPELATFARRLWGPYGLDVRLQDFCEAQPPNLPREKATLILCNPPYVRHHHLSAEQKSRLGLKMRWMGYQVSGLAGLYCYFLLLAHAWMAEKGVGVWIVPAEFLDVNYGRILKEYLTSDVSLLRIHRFDPEDVQFADALVSSVVVVFRKTSPPAGHQVELTSGGRLPCPHVVNTVPLSRLASGLKWTPLFSESIVPASQPGALAIGDLFSVKRGLATGANDFFILDRREAEALKLPARFLRPILPSPREIPGSCILANGEGFPKGLPERVLLDCDLPLEVIQGQFPTLARYLEQGHQLGIPERYLPAHRKPWYAQEERPPAPVLCTYMGRQKSGRALRFIRNKSSATAPNVYHLLYPKPALQEVFQAHPETVDWIFETLTEVANQLTVRGRVYGGGLNKIEPRELAAIELPQSVEGRLEALLRTNHS